MGAARVTATVCKPADKEYTWEGVFPCVSTNKGPARGVASGLYLTEGPDE
uniref:Uncharacterized protein n=1 Tax=Candidatus Kentrum sp. LPFa TaxID=2126335 RepID=A0A450X656_9GAMM|nr:MAG: hypothetical protein BECKLPF1236B_GA0070989_14261 [Candidatus Kentron sp. LPFa]